MVEATVSRNCEYQSITCFDDRLYCVIANMNGAAHEMDVLDKFTLERIEPQTFSEEIGGVLNSDNSLIAVLDNTLYELFGAGKKSKLCDMPEKTYVSQSMVNGHHIYIFARNTEKIKNKNTVELGYIIDYDIYEKVSQCTPLHLSGKNNDSLVFFPVTR